MYIYIYIQQITKYCFCVESEFHLQLLRDIYLNKNVDD